MHKVLCLGILLADGVLKRNWIQSFSTPATAANLQISYTAISLYAATMSNVRLRDPAKNFAQYFWRGATEQITNLKRERVRSDLFIDEFIRIGQPHMQPP